MLLTISTTHSPATDLGYLLAKHPERVQSFEQSFGRAHVFYPEASAERTTVALLLDVDPVALVRTRRGPAGEGGALEQYVNDRPYVASSFLSVAIAQVFGEGSWAEARERILVWAHVLLVVGFLAYLPHSKHLHIATAAVNVWFGRTRSRGRSRSTSRSRTRAQCASAPTRSQT